MMPTLALVLHCHIPWCRKSGVWPAGEEWLFEALNETYLPLLRVLRTWRADRVRAHLTIGVVPVLTEQLADPYLQGRFDAYLDDRVARAESDLARFAADPSRARVAAYWRDRFQANRTLWRDEIARDVLGALREEQEAGLVEVITSAATHGFLPLLERDSSVRAQVRTGVTTYAQHFGRRPRGFWLPECAYRPAERDAAGRERRSIDAWLVEEGIEWVVVESVGLTRARFLENRHAESAPDPFRAYALPSGLTVYGRNEATGRQVWSAQGGYPGDPAYREFHRKDPVSGLHYHAVTGAEEKALYDPEVALERVRAHAAHFVARLAEEGARAAGAGIADPLVVAPYDGELFGHWWHEGVDWIDALGRALTAGGGRTTTLAAWTDAHRDERSVVAMERSTWGLGADFTVWQNPEHGWVWPLVNGAARELEEVLALHRDRPVDERGARILRQACREALLSQASDWPFLLYTGQAREYANQRFHHHDQRLRRLLWAARDLADGGRISEADLREMEDVDCAWPDLDITPFG